MSWGEISCINFGECPFKPTFQTCHKACPFYTPKSKELEAAEEVIDANPKSVGVSGLTKSQKRKLRKKCK